jgi:hypothetical protein
LKFKLYITEVEQLLEHQYLEQDEGINPFPASVALTLLRVPLIQKRSNGSQGIDSDRRLRIGFFS